MKEIIKNTTWADRLLFFCLLLLSISGIFISRDALSHGSVVTIEVDRKPAYTFPLDFDKLLSIEGPNGKTLIEIQGGKVRIKKAGCRNQICVKEGWVSRGVIVCVPNKLVVIVGGSKAEQQKNVDAVTG